MNQDDYDVASLAAMTNGRINQINSKFGKVAVPKVDIRQAIGHHPQQGHYPQQGYYPQHVQQPQYPQYQQPYPQQGGVGEYGLPETVPANMSQLPLIIRDRDGNIIDLNQAPSAANDPSFAPQGASQNSDYQGFHIPNYGGQTNQEKIKSNNLQESSLDIILKEIKSLKKSVNKLIRELGSVKVTDNKSQPDTKNDFNIESSDISKRVHPSATGSE
jgi:hypothetical protein